MINLFKRWFKADYSVCTECGVHFEPISDYDAQVGILCQVHRKPAFALLRRKEFVQRWAALNWEKLEAQALKEDSDNREKQIKYHKNYNNLWLYNDNDTVKDCIMGNGGIVQFANPEAITQANLQSAHDHNQGRDQFLWPL